MDLTTKKEKKKKIVASKVTRNVEVLQPILVLLKEKCSERPFTLYFFDINVWTISACLSDSLLIEKERFSKSL